MENEKFNEDVQLDNEVRLVMPLVDILDGSDGVTMYFEVPGANAKTVEIEVKNQVMTITAASSLRRDGVPIVFKRGFRLSDGADIENISARTQDGVLTLTIPKSERARVHRIQVTEYSAAGNGTPGTENVPGVFVSRRFSA